MNRAEPAGLYVHVPFCKTKCPYCGFYSVTSLSRVGQWLEALKKEVLLYKDRFPAFDSLYFGGGTPSLLGDRELLELFEFLHLHFELLKKSEITIELNPDDVNAEKLAFLKDLGINRLSLGVQSFNEKELLFLNRRHTARQAIKALELIRSAGFKNIGIDLMYGFDAGKSCGQTVKKRWLESLSRALRFEPEHLSCYQLTFENRTPFGKMRDEGKIRPLGEKRESGLFILTSRFLEERGYIHYEISNFARSPELISRHNSKYWSHVPYLGLGPAAHSFKAGMRWWNTPSLDGYCRALLIDGKAPVEESETLEREQLVLESLYLGLRTKKGVDADLIPRSGGPGAALAELEKSGLLQLKEGKVVPTRKGFLVADSFPVLLSP